MSKSSRTSPSGQRLTPLALIDLCEAQKRPKSVTPNSLMTPTTVYSTPKSTRHILSSVKNRRRYDSVPEGATTTLGQIFATHSLKTTASSKLQTPPRNGNTSTVPFRRQQSASATMVGNSRSGKPIKESHSAYSLGRPASSIASNKGIFKKIKFAFFISTFYNFRFN